MSGHLHELLAVEKTTSTAASKLLAETNEKFNKRDTYFQGYIKTLAMINDGPESKAIEAAGREGKALATDVVETLEYALGFWAKAEDVLFQKNRSNQRAISDIMFRGAVLATNVPVDELMGLETRLTGMRGLMAAMPTLDASKEWVRDADQPGQKWKLKEPEVTARTEKVMTPVVLAAATDKHPAQVEKVIKDVVVGTFTTNRWSGAVTSVQKSDVIAVIDELIVEVKQARMRANSIDVDTGTIGKTIVDVIMAPLMK